MSIRSLCVSVYIHTQTRYFLREVGKNYAKALLLVIFGTGLGCTEASTVRTWCRLLWSELRSEPLVILDRGLGCVEAVAARVTPQSATTAASSSPSHTTHSPGTLYNTYYVISFENLEGFM